jgi:hypothetical protein
MPTRSSVKGVILNVTWLIFKNSHVKGAYSHTIARLKLDRPKDTPTPPNSNSIEDRLQ